MTQRTLIAAATLGFAAAAGRSADPFAPEGAATGDKAQKTTAELLALAEKRVETLKAKLFAETVANDIEVGDDVDFLWGKGEGRVLRSGKLSGIRTDDNGSKWFAVLYAGGANVFDDPARTFTIRLSEIKANRTAEARRKPGESVAIKEEAEAPVDPLDVA